jgi:hypothetical protein
MTAVKVVPVTVKVVPAVPVDSAELLIHREKSAVKPNRVVPTTIPDLPV